MADKKAPADGWPVISGDYIVGDPESPVAVTTLASHIEAELSGAAIAGPCKTENLGIEKVVANIISNPNPFTDTFTYFTPFLSENGMDITSASVICP
jgi:tetrahydromethanopterin S-methyltransferase subunit A